MITDHSKGYVDKDTIFYEIIPPEEQLPHEGASEIANFRGKFDGAYRNPKTQILV